MSLTLYYAPISSASPIMWALAELDLPYEAVEVDLKAGEQKRPEILEHNPMGQVPTLVDGGRGVFESSAIIVYLGERYGVARGLWPALDSAEHMAALSWNTWVAVAVGSTLRTIMLNSGEWAPAELRNAGQAAQGRERLAELMGVLDEHLTRHATMVGSGFTLVDVFGAAILGWSTRALGLDQGATPHLAAWLGRCMEREAAGQMR